MSKIDTTVLQDGQLAVATAEQSGTLISGASAIDTTCLVKTEDGVQQCVKTFPLGEGGGGDGANKDLSNISNAGKIVCSNMGMPSNTSITLTPGPSGTGYVAPADGFFRFTFNTSSSPWFILYGTWITSYWQVASNSTGHRAWVPIAKGKECSAEFSNCTITEVRFTYAIGSESEYQGE